MRTLFLLFLSLLASAACAQSAGDLIAQADAVYSANPDSSLVLSEHALQVAMEQHDSVNMAYAKAKCARYYVLKSDFEAAGEYLNAAIEMQQHIGDKNGLAYSYKLKAIVQKRIGNTDEALQLQQDAVRLYRETGNTNGMCNALANLSLDYIREKQFTEAGHALDTIAAHLDAIEGPLRYFYWHNRGKLLFAQEDYTGSLVCYDSAKVQALKYELVDSYATLLSSIAKADIKLNRLDAAEAVLLESCSLARANSLDHELDESLTVLTELYVSKGDYKNAFLTNKEQTDLAQKIYNIERINKINELEKKLDLAEKEKTIAQQDIELAEEAARKKELEQENFLLVLIISAVVLIAGLATFLLVRTRMLNTRIAQQNVLIAEKSALIEDAYGKIRDSISYSRKIQKAMLPTNESIASVFPHSFVLYEPRDIVSGDFYWFQDRANEVLFAAADCTGHGVPGAFLSIVGYNHIHQAVNIHNITSPEKILDKVRDDVTVTLKQYDDNAANDGMDVSLCAIDKRTNTLKFAGANHAAWILRGDVVHELKGNNQPIGAYPGQEILPYTLQEFQLQKNDRVYLFSDGFTDQFGGEKGAKFKAKQLRELLIATRTQPMPQQKETLLAALRRWQGSFEQIDDVLVIGIET